MKNIVKHVYQRTRNGGLLFYSDIDRLVYFSLFSSLSRRYSVTVLGLCLMIDHIHSLVDIVSHSQLTALMRDSSSRYARSFNMSSGITGQVFDKSYGWACKIGGKKIRTAIAYLYNNPVEKQLCARAEEFRWNFLAYRNNPHPFSPAISLEHASKAMRKAISEIKSARKEDSPLSYSQLFRILKGLKATERQQIIDYIISSYNCIDYDAASSYYSSFDEMMTAVHSNTGSEYDINEISTYGDDRIFSLMTKTLREECHIINPKRVLSLSKEEKTTLKDVLHGYTQATDEQLQKYLWTSRKRITKKRRKAQ